MAKETENAAAEISDQVPPVKAPRDLGEWMGLDAASASPMAAKKAGEWKIKAEKQVFRGHKGAPQLWMLSPESQPRVLESQRNLKNRIIGFNEKQGLKAFLFTGSDRKTGVSTIAMNLALTCGWDMPDRQTLMVDANISYPSLHKAFGVSPTPGLADFLYGRMPLAEVIQASCLPNVELVAFGKSNENLPSPFSLRSFADFLKLAKSRYDFIVLDSEPILRSGHSQLISSQVDAVIIVAEADRTRLEVISEMKQRLANDGANLIGSFLNRRRYVIPGWLYRYI